MNDIWPLIFKNLDTKNLLRVCMVSKQFNIYIHQFKIHEPSLFIIRKDGCPGNSRGNLLSWLSTEMDKNINKIAYFQQQINDKLYSYKFNSKDFDIYFESKYGAIYEIERFYRFVMIDGSYYLVNLSDNEYYQTYLEYIHPIVKPEILEDFKF